MKQSSPLPSKFILWIVMLLLWNSVLLSIALFYLVRSANNPFSAQDLARVCADSVTQQ